MIDIPHRAVLLLLPTPAIAMTDRNVNYYCTQDQLKQVLLSSINLNLSRKPAQLCKHAPVGKRSKPPDTLFGKDKFRISRRTISINRYFRYIMQYPGVCNPKPGKRISLSILLSNCLKFFLIINAM